MSKPSSSTDHQPPEDCPADAVGFLRGMRDLQATGTFCDVVLKGSDKSAEGIPCHRSVLCVQSPYFRAAFTHNWKESSEPVFQLANIDGPTLNELVAYAYTMDLRLSDDNVRPILIGAEFLQMSQVVRLCWEYVGKQPLRFSNCLALHALAFYHHNPALADAALDLIHAQFLRVAQSPEFLRVDALQLTALIASDELDVFSEDQVLEAVLRWLDHDRPGRMDHLPAVLQNIRASFLSEQYRQVYRTAIAANGLPTGEGQITAPRPSYDAEDVIVCVGGVADDDKSTAVQVFNPSIPAVWQLKDLPADPEGCHAVLLNASSVLIMHDDGIHTVRRDRQYLGLRDEWREVAPMLTPRRDPPLAALNGGIYVAGGRGPRTPVEVFNPQSNSWSAVAPLPIRLEGFALVACDGRLFVLGGEDRESDYGKYVFSYDPVVDKWTRLRDMPVGRHYGVACVGAGGLIFLIGGDDAKRCVRVDSYNPATNQWVRKANLVRDRFCPGCAYLKGKLYVIGGDRRKRKGKASIEVYDDETDSWTLLDCPMPENEFAPDCVVMKLKRAPADD